jgi:hypothetical protein
MSVPGVYLSGANQRLVAFVALREINKLRSSNAAFSSIPTAPTKPFH